MPSQKMLYRHAIRDNPAPGCWACGRTRKFSDKPQGWFGLWGLDRAHIVSGYAVEDRRAIVILCKLCHMLQHGYRVVSSRPRGWPKLTLGNMLWLKRHRDPGHFDLEFLRKLSIKTLPSPEEPPSCYALEYLGRHP